MSFATDLQNILKSIDEYLTSKSNNIPKWSNQYNILDVALKQVNYNNSVEFNKRVVRLFEEYKSKISENKLNDYFVEALRNKNYQLVLWLAKRNPTHECFLKDLKNIVKCEDKPNLEECIENILYGLYRGYVIGGFAEKTNFNCMDLLLKIGIDINRQDNKGDTNLLMTIRENFGNVEYLLSRGADPNIQNMHGDTPLMEAVKWCNDENIDVINTVKLLLKYKANPNIRNKNGDTPLFKVARCKDKGKEIAKLLIEAGADVNVISNDRDTPLKLASIYNNSVLYDFLIEKGAKVEYKGIPIIKRDIFSDLLP